MSNRTGVPSRYQPGLLASQLRYLFGRRPWPIELPIVVQFPVNDICDSKCQMCNIWQQKRDHEISPDEVRRLFESALFRRVRTIGMNGGEPTLRRDLAEIGSALIDAVPSLQRLSVITNGLHAERVIARLEELAGVAGSRGVSLDIMVSLDGVGDTHDRVRGAVGNFQQADRVIRHFSNRPDTCSLRVGCTVIRENVHGLHDLHEYCADLGVYVKYRLGVPNRRLYNLESAGPKQIGKRTWLDTRPFGMDAAERWHFAQFLLGLVEEYETSLSQIQFYRSLVEQLIHERPRRAGCDWAHRGVTVSSRGEIIYCAVQSRTLGSGLTEDPLGLYLHHSDYLESIAREKCAGCAHDYVGPPGGRWQAALALDRVLGRFGSSVRQARRSAAGRAAMTIKRRAVDPLRFARTRRGVLRRAGQAVTVDRKSQDVIVCGWYGTETLGDKAILAAVVQTLRAVEPAARPVVASLEPGYTRLTVEQMPELAGCEVVTVGETLERVAGSRAVVFGGGPLMAIREMADMEALFVRARVSGVPRIVAGCGVGPLGAEAFNRSIGGLLHAASHRIYRDERSRQAAAERFGVDTRDDQIADDPAATWLGRWTRSPRDVDASPVLALGLRDWPHDQYAPQLGDAEGVRLKGRFEDAVGEALVALAREVPGLRILPVPFCTHAVGGDDRWLYRRLLRNARGLRSITDTSLLAQERAPDEYVSRLSSARAILTMRFHSLVFASALGLPAVAIDYTGGQGKTHSLAARMNVPTRRLEDLTADWLAGALREVLLSPAPARSNEPGFEAAFRRAWMKGT